MCDECRYEGKCYREAEAHRVMLFAGEYDLSKIREQMKDCNCFIEKPKHWAD